MKIDYQKIQQAKWYRQESSSTLYFTLSPALGVHEFFKGGQNVIFCHKKNIFKAYFNEEYFLKLARLYFHKYRKDRKHLDRIFNQWLSWSKDFEKLIDKIREIDLNKLSDKDLLILNSQLSKKSYEFWTKFFMDIYDISTETIINEEFNKSGIKINSKKVQILLQPDKLLASQRYHKNLLELFLLINKKSDFIKIRQLPKKAQGKAVEILDKFYFIYSSHAKAKELTFKILIKDLDYLSGVKINLKKELLNLQKYQINLKNKKQRIYKAKNFSKWHKDIFYYFSTIAYWRDRRKMMSQKAVMAQNKLVKEISKRSRVPWSDVGLCLPYAINTMPVSKKLIDHFKSVINYNYLSVWNKKQKKVEFLSKKTCDKLMKYLELSNIEFKQINGQIAFPGKVRGKVKIITGEKSFCKFKHNEILVTASTRPEFVPLIKKAKAIITDEGGITSHAAMVSREFKTPCIIGTKIATRVLKNGDMVEVDANKGVITILSE